MQNPFEEQNYGTTWSPTQAGQYRPQSGNYYGYFNPNTDYGGADYQDANGNFTDFWQGIRYQYLNDNPSAVWSMFTSPFGGGNAAYDQWLRSQESPMNDAYLAALSVNPDLSRQQYYEGVGYNGLLDRYLQQAPQQRQVNPSAFGAGRVQTYIY